MTHRHRFFLSRDAFSGNQVLLKGQDGHQLRRVLRLKVGDLIEVLDGMGHNFLVALEKVEEEEIEGRIIEVRKDPEECSLAITLAQVLPRFTKMDLIVQKATELGVARIVPLVGDRTPFPKGAQAPRVERWQRIAKEAAEQCRRITIPELEPIQNLLSFLDRLDVAGKRILFWERETGGRLRKILKVSPAPSDYVLLVGPEGGFSDREAEKAVEKGYESVSLGARILRTESVALVALSLLQYEKGNLG